VIEVDVALPADLAPGTLLNQARLLDLPGSLGVEVLSEFPGTPQLPDPTPVLVLRCADLGVEKSAETAVAGPGDEVSYTIRVTNHGPSDATGIDSVADSLPEGLIFGSASDGGVLNLDGVIRWPAFDLAAGAHRDLTVTATADADVRRATEDDGDLDNTASVHHPGDTVPGNDRDTAVVPVDHPDLVVEKDDGLRMVDPGEEVTYTITVRNAGQGDAHGVVLTDQLPDELEYLHGTAQPRYRAPATVSWPPFDLAAGEEHEVTVTARVADDVAHGAEVLNVAAAPHPDDPNPGDNRDDDLDGVERPSPRDRPPTPEDDDPPITWLPRTGLQIGSWLAIAVGLITLGLAARWWGRAKPS
jgi:uncharacterized repeat protein (TIGR01451 family)